VTGSERAVVGAIVMVAEAATAVDQTAFDVAGVGVVDDGIATFVDGLRGVEAAAVRQREVAVDVLVQAVGKAATGVPEEI